MTKKSASKNIVNEIPEASLFSFRRTQWFETAKIVIQIFLMGVFALALFVFLILVILAGVTQSLFPDTVGVRALITLFRELQGKKKKARPDKEQSFFLNKSL